MWLQISILIIVLYYIGIKIFKAITCRKNFGRTDRVLKCEYAMCRMSQLCPYSKHYIIASELKDALSKTVEVK